MQLPDKGSAAKRQVGHPTAATPAYSQATALALLPAGPQPNNRQTLSSSEETPRRGSLGCRLEVEVVETEGDEPQHVLVQ